ncbi:MAG: 2-oxo acid dehydrogenase subunit E2, partial [ANME-2 cluster archaeon]
MVSKIIMPQGGQDLTTGRLIRWLKREGEVVSKGEVICEVETEKTVLEVNAMQDGILLNIIAKEGEEVEILSTIGYIGEKGEKLPDIEHSQEEFENINNKDKAFLPKLSTSKKISIENENVRISPKARKLARDHNIPIESLNNIHADGKITTDDVLKIIHKNQMVEVNTEAPENVIVQIPKPIQKAAARRLGESWRASPHIFVTVAVDMSASVNFRKRYSELIISLNDLIVRTCVIALAKFPAINASYENEDKLNVWKDINIGLAVNSSDGLVVAVVEDADRLSLKELSEEIKRVIEKTHEGRQEATKPSRFTVSNLGMYGVDQFSA